MSERKSGNNGTGNSLTVLAVLVVLGLLLPAASAPAQSLSGGGSLTGSALLKKPEVTEGDSRCAYRGHSTEVPSGWSCYQFAVLDFIREELASGRLTPGPGINAASALERLLPLPAIEWLSCPRWIEGGVTNTGTYAGCAAGVAGPENIFVSLAEPERKLPLVAWETANTLVYWRLQRWDLADSDIIARATEYAAAHCNRALPATQ